jgi:hypothetical protein
MDMPGYVTLEVSVNLVDFSSDGILFSYQTTTLTALQPRQGPTAGGTLLTIVGFDMTHLACLPQGQLSHESAGLSCTFQTHVTGTGLGRQQEVPATQQTAASLICRTPALVGASSTSEVAAAVRVHMFNSSISGSLLFAYLPRSFVSAV